MSSHPHIDFEVDGIQDISAPCRAMGTTCWRKALEVAVVRKLSPKANMFNMLSNIVTVQYCGDSYEIKIEC